MIRKKVLLFGLLLVTLFLLYTGCGKVLTGDEKTAVDYVTAHGYAISAYKGEVQKYTLEKNLLYGGSDTIPYQQVWGVQKTEPDPYFGKEIAVYAFTVDNHPLEKMFKVRTTVDVMMSDGQVIGGFSFPDEKGLVGAPYSFDGQTLEEVTGLSFQQWRTKWAEKYGK